MKTDEMNFGFDFLAKLKLNYFQLEKVLTFNLSHSTIRLMKKDLGEYWINFIMLEVGWQLL